MRRTLLVAGILGAAALFAGSAATVPAQHHAAARQALNPQPLPPGRAEQLNPQPLPPGIRVTLNPQPLPPGFLPPNPI
jgi:hypothetical protein